MLPMASVLSNLGVKRALVVHGNDGLDEITLTDTTTVCEVNGSYFDNYILDPREMGFTFCEAEELRGGEPKKMPRSHVKYYRAKIRVRNAIS